ncbi:hypothetical protein BCV69DRAFT_280842 [Microstroma glucosiphilum]|uniref:Dihydroorotate dehydrogenase (quinone), mitochondrial n=1 Tax=Pseudomicrostroma glucosiphilum TaxID=1684307 RepID=A0A316UDF1_9BASI|nr:hypothetical protein BCV69DRAFT_280842 [Pseudomicrostroma glucosiphilum]PWN23229.1 hypothetical protein BCV69DRAFT_280842 [Pseudomicrostroma glucosiphilum]
MASSSAHSVVRAAIQRRLLTTAQQQQRHTLLRSPPSLLVRHATTSSTGGMPQPTPVQNVPSASPLSAAPQAALPKSSPVVPAVSPPTPQVVPSPHRPKPSGSGFFGKVVSYSLFLFGGTFLVTYYLDSRSAIHRWVAMPFLHSFVDAEEGQKLAIQLLKSGLAPKDYTGDEDSLATELFGQPLVNPIGLAAGFDKQAEAIDGLFDLGFGIVEVGSVTPEPQPGNPKPRYFRLPSQSASINRYGFNSDGHKVVLGRLLARVRDHLILHPELIPAEFLPDLRSPDVDPRLTRHEAVHQAATKVAQDPALVARLLDHIELPRSLRPGHMLSINLGKNKTSAESDASDFVKGVERFGPLADMLVINVSSPNTPGLRDLQKRDALKRLLKEVVKARNELPHRQTKDGAKGKQVPLVVKISPDLSEGELDSVASTVLSSGIDGVIISNTTVQRPASLAATLPQGELATLQETGGLSGPPLRPIARKALQRIAGKLRSGGVEVIAAGGISTPEDVLQASRDGASAIQVYTAFGWQGVGMISRWKEELRSLLASPSSPTSFLDGAKGVEKDGGKSTTWKLLARDVKTSLAAAEEERKKADARAFSQSGSEVKKELEQLKQSLGGSRSESSEKAAPSSAPVTGAGVGLGDVWFPDEKDESYNSLLSSTRKALGLDEPSRAASSSSSSSSPKSDDTLSERISSIRQQSSQINPLDATPAPPVSVLQGSEGTSNPTETRGRQEEKSVVFVNEGGKPLQVTVQPIKGAAPGSSKSTGEKAKGAVENKVEEWKQWAGVDKGRRV